MRACEQCGGPIPSTKRQDARFCDVKCRAKATYYRNHEVSCEVRRRYYQTPEGRQRHEEAARRWREANPDRRRQVGRDHYHRYGDRNREVGRVRAHGRRAAAGDGVSPEDWAIILDRHDYRCAYCAAPWEHMDHKVPLSLGGEHSPHNVVPACSFCNLSKGATPLEVFLAA